MAKYKQPTIYALVCQHMNGDIAVHGLSGERAAKRLTKTMRSGHIDMGNFTVWFAYQSWLKLSDVKRAVRLWMDLRLDGVAR